MLPVVKLIRVTDDPITLLQKAYSQCYQKPADIHTIRRHLKHQSVLEHVTFTFEVECSRACLAQLTRHRIASYTVQSQRYTKADFMDLIKFFPLDAVPDDMIDEVREHLINTFRLYEKMLKKGVRKEDARMILPNSTAVKLVFTMNLREIIHFLTLRLSQHAQAEIRALAEQIKDLVLEALPDLKEDLEEVIKNGMQC